MRARIRDESGQTVVEYMLLIAAIVSLFGIVRVGLIRFHLTEKLMKPLTEEFAKTYQYGYPKTKGYDDGGPNLHPRAVGGNNFRLFANPFTP